MNTNILTIQCVLFSHLKDYLFFLKHCNISTEFSSPNEYSPAMLDLALVGAQIVKGITQNIERAYIT